VSTAIRIGILANARQAVGELKRTGTAADDLGKHTKKAGASIAAMATGAVGIGTIAVAFKTGVDEASKFNDATQQVTQALGTNKNLAGLTAAEVQKNSAAIETLTGAKVDENDASKAQATLIRAGISDRTQLSAALKTAADVSSGTGKDIGAVSVALAKALANPAKAGGVLAKVGVVLSKSQLAAIAAMKKGGDAAGAQTAILSALETHYDGAAKAAGTGFSADVGRAKDALADSERDIVQKVMPTLAKLAQSFSQELPHAIAILTPAARIAVGLFTNPLFLAAAGTVAGLVVAWKVYQGVMAIVKGVTAAYTAVQGALNVVMALNPIGLVVLAIVALIAIVVIIATKTRWFQELWHAAMGAMSAAVHWIVTAAAAVFSWLGSHWPLILAIITGPLGLVVLAVAKNWDKIMAAFKAIPSKIASVAKGMWDPIKNAFKSVINWVIGAWNKLELRIPPVDTHLPGVGKIGGFALETPNIPLMGRGGIVSSPTLLVAGEAGPEAIVPLDRLGGNTYSISVYVAPGADPAEVGRQTVRSIEAYERQSGRRRLVNG
jgi:hypothetical protein